MIYTNIRVSIASRSAQVLGVFDNAHNFCDWLDDLRKMIITFTIIIITCSGRSMLQSLENALHLHRIVFSKIVQTEIRGRAFPDRRVNELESGGISPIWVALNCGCLIPLPCHLDAVRNTLQRASTINFSRSIYLTLRPLQKTLNNWVR